MIRDCLYRYCRGIDRIDEALLRSSYWPDGTDNHGAYRGSASGFVDWAMQALPAIERGIHQIHNILIELHGNEAAVESYFTALQRQPNADGARVEVHMAGRYVDRFEKRGEEWRVANRVVVFDWVEERPAPEKSETERFAHRQPIGGRWPADPVLMIEGFPNLFVIAGPNGPSALANFILLNEQNVDWVCDCITHMRTEGVRSIEANVDAEDAWMKKVTTLGSLSLYPTANTWYTGANVPGKPRTFPVYIGGLGRYREICADAAAEGYRGFTLR